MRYSRPLVIAALLALLAGCSLAPPLPPAPSQPALAEPATLKRQLTFERDDDPEPQTLIALIRLDGSELRAALLTPYGQRLVTLVQDADGSRYVAGDVPLAEIEQRRPTGWRRGCNGACGPPRRCARRSPARHGA